MDSLAHYGSILYDIIAGFSALFFLAKLLGKMDRLLALEPKISRMAAQLMPNGGSSAVDRIERLERDMKLLRKEFAELKQVNQTQLTKLEKIDAATSPS